ncbi:alcohol dehydrogenase catalytic domain-containing protein [Neptunomonas japonica]|uniref:alcohol dehydrogenase catalytic domain-containing protein n=1 Tax=Neptunomonas japonica TaxID=417574 RepID=UPI000405C46A|nr:alcohol dehydrogenase catalytic domain-containing protein [Neptunomonas japonica]
MSSKTMNALVYTDRQEITYRREPLPQPREGDVRVDITATAICGSDMHAYHGKDARRVPPLILGHEVSGIVLDGRYAGQRMVINPLMTCGECEDCVGGRSNLCRHRELIGMYLPGAFAEQVAIAERNLLPIPADMNPIHAALTEPTATGLHAVALVERVLPRPLSEARCLVIGGGAIGLLTALILKAKGCISVDLAETNALRRSSIEQQDCANCFNPLKEALPYPNGYEVVFDCVGCGATRRRASEAVRPGGIISHVGLQDDGEGLDTRKLTLQEVILLGNYCYTRADMQASIDMLYRGQLGNLSWIDVRPLSTGAQAFTDLHNGKVAAAKIVLQPDTLL